jgi:hypothetical protein
MSEYVISVDPSVNINDVNEEISELSCKMLTIDVYGISVYMVFFIWSVSNIAVSSFNAKRDIELWINEIALGRYRQAIEIHFSYLSGNKPCRYTLIKFYSNIQVLKNA